VIRVIAVVVLALAGAHGAAAQTTAPRSRGFVVVNGDYQFTANNFTNGAVKQQNAENGRFDTNYGVKAGPAFDVAGGGVFWRTLAVGVEVSRFSIATPASLSATIPHPFFFDRPRSISGDVAGLKREEMAVHVQARLGFPVGTRFQLTVFGGPSFFQVKQGMVTDYTYTDSYPYDVAQFSAATTTNASVSKIGFIVGGDFAFFFTKQVGVGVTVQFAGTTVVLPGAGGGTQTVNVGGTNAGGGLRLRF
jgi:hypothetical protein